MKYVGAAVLVLLALFVVAVPRASADLGMTMTMSMNLGGTGMVVNSEMQTRIKASKMRADVRMMGQDLSVLFDQDAKQVLMINHATKEISIAGPGALAANNPVAFGEAAVSMKPTGETRVLLGRTCQGFAIEMTVPMTVGADTITMRMSGTIWIADKGPGVEEYKTLSKAAAASGFSTAFMTQGPTMKGMVEVQKTMAEAGIPLAQEFRMSMEGTGQAAAMMSQMGNMTMTMTVTALSTDPIGDDVFVEPAGYTKK
jgi:hypothetical protein